MVLWRYRHWRANGCAQVCPKMRRSPHTHILS
uniref:Uncharacterized protein n=1 Tax=Parascaris equorum TaxID=6256 RepID=A0A914R4F2_PAREQ